MSATEALAGAAAEAEAPAVSGRRQLPGIGLLLPAAILIGWELAAAAGLVSTRLVPPPSTVLATIAKLAASGELWGHLAATLWRVLTGFGIGVAAGTVFGAVTGYSGFAHRLLDPMLQGLRAIPSLAWVPLFILWFGIFETSKVLLVAVGVFFPVYLALASAIHNVDRKLVEVGRIYRFSDAMMIRRILLPAALPTYLVGLRGGLGLGWMFVVAAELMGASEGLGYLLVDGQQTGRADAILASLVLFAIVGKITDMILAAAGHRLVAWQDSFKPGG